jgi:DNA-binding transcriptional MerR regulator
MDTKQPQFTQAEVLEATGLDAATLQTWANRRIVVPASEHPGRAYGQGGRRLYSGEDVIWIAILKRLTDFQLPIGLAAAWCDAASVRSNLRQYGSLPLAYVVSPWRDGSTMTDSIRPADEIPEGAQSILTPEGAGAKLAEFTRLALVIPARKIEQETTKQLSDILKRRETDAV